MRPIKFRAKPIQMTLPSGEELLGDFVVGTLIKHKDGIHRILTPIDGGFANYKVAPNTISQSTGLCDRNGKEIYEGDKLLIIEGTRAFTAYVVWDDLDAKFGLDFGLGMGVNPKPLGEWIRGCKCEVLGNIYDNPEWRREVKNEH